MPPRKRSSPEGANSKEHWLRSEDPARWRPWVYEELLFGSSRDRTRTRELGALLEELASERVQLARLHRELDEHLARIDRLQAQLNELAPAPEQGEPRPVLAKGFPGTRAPPPDEGDSHASLAERSYSLARCEGFQVEGPTGPVGFVEGLRFVSRIDQPDLLAVRGGRFGRQLLLIPTDQVDEVRLDEESVVIRSAPNLSGDLLGDLVDSVRGALHFDHAAS